MIKKYNVIIRCRLHKGDESYSNQLILASDTDKEFDVDLTGDLLFNEFEVAEITTLPVSTLEQVYSYCKQNRVELPTCCVTEKGLIVGGSRDFIINEELEGSWFEKPLCISVQSLHKHFGKQLSYCSIATDDEGHFDLRTPSFGIVCMDGEECEVEKKEEGMVHLVNQNGEQPAHFRLTLNEFTAAFLL